MGFTCDRCELSQYRANIVLGRGNKNAKIAILGEAPGRDEDIAGKPFVGSCGRLMTRMLTELGITDDDYFVTNTVRCRPPGNRAPKLCEIAACNEFLVQELNGFTTIMSVGKTPLMGLLGTQHLRLDDYIGKPMELELGGIKRTLIPNYHPAYILRFRTLREEWMSIAREAFNAQ